MLTVSELKAVLAVPKNELLSYATGTDPENPFTLPPPFKFQESLWLFADYLQSMENFLDVEAHKLDEEFKHEKEEADKRVSEQLREYKEIFHDEYGNLSTLAYFSDRVDEFANILRKSFFLNLYGFFESQLEQLCHSLENYDNMPQWPTDSKLGSILDLAKPFLKEIGFPLGYRVWQEITHYRRLRNCIVHSEGRIDRFRDETTLRRYIIDRTGSLTFNGNEIVLKKEFCEEALCTVRDDFYRRDLLLALVNWWSRITS